MLTLLILIMVQAAVDAKYYGNVEVFNLLKTRGAKPPVCYLTKCFMWSLSFSWCSFTSSSCLC